MFSPFQTFRSLRWLLAPNTLCTLPYRIFSDVLTTEWVLSGSFLLWRSIQRVRDRDGQMLGLCGRFATVCQSHGAARTIVFRLVGRGKTFSGFQWQMVDGRHMYVLIFTWRPLNHWDVYDRIDVKNFIDPERKCQPKKRVEGKAAKQQHGIKPNWSKGHESPFPREHGERFEIGSWMGTLFHGFSTIDRDERISKPIRKTRPKITSEHRRVHSRILRSRDLRHFWTTLHLLTLGPSFSNRVQQAVWGKRRTHFLQVKCMTGSGNAFEGGPDSRKILFLEKESQEEISQNIDSEVRLIARNSETTRTYDESQRRRKSTEIPHQWGWSGSEHWWLDRIRIIKLYR